MGGSDAFHGLFSFQEVEDDKTGSGDVPELWVLKGGQRVL
jgi:hypothetical protein